MSALPAAPAGLLRRYAAWSLDMALPACAALALCAPALQAGLPRLGAAFEALLRSLAGALIELPAQGGSVLALSRLWLSDPGQQALAHEASQALWDLALPPLLLAWALALAWFTFWEASSRQATPGKRALGLRVSTLEGARPGAARVAARQLAGTLSWLSLNLGHLLALAPPRHQALHDRIAGTRVSAEHAPGAALPAWAWAWLALQLAASVAAMARLTLGAQAAMLRALEALPA